MIKSIYFNKLYPSNLLYIYLFLTFQYWTSAWQNKISISGVHHTHQTEPNKILISSAKAMGAEQVSLTTLQWSP